MLGVLEDNDAQVILSSALNKGLEALHHADAVLAATEKCSKDSAAPIWQALGRGDDSVRAVLSLTEPEIAQLAAGRQQRGDMGAISPLSLTFYGVVSGLRKHCKSVLFEVRCLLAAMNVRSGSQEAMCERKRKGIH
jgi:hypothetical protein